jgi:hypothetical protein
MASFATAGNNVTQRIIFNSGTLDFGNNRLVDMDNITVSVEWTLATLYVVNSIKPADINRHSQRISLSAKVKSFSPEVVAAMGGSSVGGTPNEQDLLDGQASFTNPVVTFFDRNGKQIQYQLQNAVFKSYKTSAKAEDYADFDIELEAKDMICLNAA